MSQDNQKTVRTLVVRHWGFFCKRDKHNNLLPEWSTEMLRDASNTWPWVLIFDLDFPDVNSRFSDTNNRPPWVSLKGASFRLGLHNVEVVELDPTNSVDTSEEIKRSIIRNGGKFDLPGNPHNFTLDVKKYVIGSHFTWVDRDDHLLAKISLDKPLNFREIAAAREAKTIW